MYLKCRQRRIKMSKKKYRIYTVTGIEVTKWGRDFVAESPEKARAKAMEAVRPEGWEFWDEYESSTEFEAVQSEPLTFDKFLLTYRDLAIDLYKNSLHNQNDWVGREIMNNIVNLERAYPEYYGPIRGSAKIDVRCWDLIAEKKDQQRTRTEQELRDENII
jgi:hypothetical protein